jgi:beta-lactamase class A
MFNMPKLLVMPALLLAIPCAPAVGGSLQQQALQEDLVRLTAGFDGRVGVGVEENATTVFINGEQHFSLQSVMKLIVAMAVLDEEPH